ncbi:MFS general substrate transporter [Sanghuangporus baumii]|uniref:MFS general substrate transporter n=1 Tax=Sanghuangporus baumii TaxID=108892 RepID=A0A9Q5NA58_SANBA|nr:MFS general substrate transporter [Sanghuangporus baumii]
MVPEPIVVEQSTKENPGLHWSEDEVQEIAYNNKKIVVPALMITTFPSALDQTIAAVSLSKIVEDIGGESGFNPLHEKFSDIIGRKPILFFSIGMFLFGSALGGAAQSFIWLALYITSLQERSKCVGLMGATMGIASIIGPLLGGALTDHASWRWCYWINLPLGGLALVLLFFFLHLNPAKRRTIREAASAFNFVGLSLLTSGIILFLFGLEDANTASGGWHGPQTLAPLIIGVVLLTSELVNEIITNREPIIPPRHFKTRTTAGYLSSVFIRSFVFFSIVYYTPLYFQIRGSTATMAGVRQLPLPPLPIGAAITSMGTGMMFPKTGRYRPVLWAGDARRDGQHLDREHHLPIRTCKATQNISEMSSSPNSNLPDFTSVSRIQLDSLRQQVTHALTRSIATIFISFTPVSFVPLLLLLTVRQYSLKRNFERAPKQGKGSSAFRRKQISRTTIRAVF